MKLNKNAAILADTHYIEKKLVGENVNVTLPSVEWLTQAIKAAGNADVPLYGLTDNLEANVTTDGTNDKTGAYIKPGLRKHEFRWVKAVVKKDGTTSNVGCKAFTKMLSKNIPEIGVEPQEATEGSYDYTVMRYQYYEDGKEVFCIDKLAGICRIGGKDYSEKLKNYLY